MTIQDIGSVPQSDIISILIIHPGKGDTTISHSLFKEPNFHPNFQLNPITVASPYAPKLTVASFRTSPIGFEVTHWDPSLRSPGKSFVLPLAILATHVCMAWGPQARDQAKTPWYFCQSSSLLICLTIATSDTMSCFSLLSLPEFQLLNFLQTRVWRK